MPVSATETALFPRRAAIADAVILGLGFRLGFLDLDKTAFFVAQKRRRISAVPRIIAAALILAR